MDCVLLGDLANLGLLSKFPLSSVYPLMLTSMIRLSISPPLVVSVLIVHFLHPTRA